MRKLVNIINDDSKAFRSKANNLMVQAKFEIGKVTDDYAKALLTTVIHNFGHSDRIDYRALKTRLYYGGFETQLRHDADKFAVQVTNIWDRYQRNFDILPRVFMALVARKATPPWLKVSLNLKTPIRDEKQSARMGSYFNSYLNAMVDQLLASLRQSALNEETFPQMLTRVRRTLKLKDPKFTKSREANYGFKTTKSDNDEAYWMETKYPDAFSVTPGVYTGADVTSFVQDVQTSNQWDYRKRASTQAQGEMNDNLRKLDQLLNYDAAKQLQSGQLQIGSEEMGIDDMQWETLGQNVCDECSDRDGLTATEISDEIDDDYGDEPPPLHINCNCRYNPKIKTDWAEDEVKDAGYEWDNDTGGVYKPDQQEVDAGWSSLSLDDYLTKIGADNE